MFGFRGTQQDSLPALRGTPEQGALLAMRGTPECNGAGLADGAAARVRSSRLRRTQPTKLGYFTRKMAANFAPESQLRANSSRRTSCHSRTRQSWSHLRMADRYGA